jgi:hypothetical protein
MATLTRPRQVQIAQRFETLQRALARLLARKLQTFFRQQAMRVVDQYLLLSGVKMAENELLGDQEIRWLQLTVTPILSEAWLQAGGLASELVGGEPLSGIDPALQTYLNEAGERIRGIQQETLRGVRKVLVEGSARQYSPYQIAHGVPADDFRGLSDVVEETYRGRADRIARTELAFASQRAAHDRYRDAGLSLVDIVDGVDCGWANHDDPDHANGSVRTLIEAEQYPIAHPDCIRISLPRIEE